MFTGALVKIAAEYILIGSIGIVGAPVSTFLCTLTVAAMNVFFIEKKTPHKLDIGFLWRALAATAVAILLSVAVFAAVCRVGETIALFAAIIAAVAVYIPLGIKLRAVRYEDILQLPRGEKIAKFLEKIKLIEVKNENTKRKDRVSRR
jgi:O-antigen/teichoic acid export membrane protein